MITLYKKELSYYLSNSVGYIILILFAGFANFLFVKDVFLLGSVSMRPFFSVIPWLFMIFVPAISMRSISEERRTNTIETLLTLPVSETQIVRILKEVEKGKLVKDVCREYGISDATYYNWKAKYGGMDASDIKRLKDLEQENRRLKQMYADLSLEHTILKDIVEKKL